MVQDQPTVASVCRMLPTPDDPSGGVFVLRRIEALARKTNVKLLQPLPYLPFLRPLPEWADKPSHETCGLQVQHAPMVYVPKFFKSLDGYWLYRSVLGKLRALRERGAPDVIDSHFAYPDGVGCVRAARALGIPVFVTIRGVEVDQLQSPIVGHQIRRALGQADGCIAVSHSLRNVAVEAGVPVGKMRVIHNAVDRAVFRPHDQAKARRLLDFPDEGSLIVSVGNLLSVKGHHILLSAFAELRTHQPNARLAIIGGAMHELQYARELHLHAERLNIRDHVIFTGKLEVEDVVSWLSAADLFALASKREGCCNAVLEALACGIPVVTTPVGDNTWFVNDNENGYIMPVGDSRAMARALLAALERKDWDRHRISAGLQVGDWDTVAGEVLEFFSERTEGRFVNNPSVFSPERQTSGLDGFT